MFKISNEVAALLVYSSLLIYPVFSVAVKEAKKGLTPVDYIKFNVAKCLGDVTETPTQIEKITLQEESKHTSRKNGSCEWTKEKRNGVRKISSEYSKKSSDIDGHNDNNVNELQKILLTLGDTSKNYAPSKNTCLGEVNPDLLYASYKPIFDLGGKNLKSVFCGLQDILSNERKESYVSEEKGSDILENIQEDLDEFKKVSKTLFPEIVSKISLHSMNAINTPQNVTQAPTTKATGVKEFYELENITTTSRYSSGNGTVKVLIGKWNLQSDIPNQKEYFKKFEVISRTSFPKNESEMNSTGPPISTLSNISANIFQPTSGYQDFTNVQVITTTTPTKATNTDGDRPNLARIATEQTIKLSKMISDAIANITEIPHTPRNVESVKSNLDKNQKLNEFDTTFVPGVNFWRKTNKVSGNFTYLPGPRVMISMKALPSSPELVSKKAISYFQKPNINLISKQESVSISPLSYELTMPMLALLPPLPTESMPYLTTQLLKKKSELTTTMSGIIKAGYYTPYIYTKTISKPWMMVTAKNVIDLKETSPIMSLFDQLKLIENMNNETIMTQDLNIPTESTPSMSTSSNQSRYVNPVGTCKTCFRKEPTTVLTTSVTTSIFNVMPSEITTPGSEEITTTLPPKNPYPQKSSVPERPITEIQDGTSGMYGLQPYNPSMTVREYVSLISDKAAIINNRNMIAQWNHETNMTHRNYKIAMVSTLALIHYQRIQNQYLDTLKDVQICDPMLEREIKLLYLPGMCILPDIKVAVFEELLFAMDTIFSSASVTAWHNPHIRYHLPDIKRIMVNSNIPEELSYYWTEWRNATGRKLRRLYEQYVELMNLTAISNGFCDASEMWTRDYETEDFMQLMGCHWEEIRPLYLELHAFVRYKLHKHYGDVTMSDDYSLPIPAHLVGDLWGQTWKSLFNITRPYDRVYDHPTMDIRSKGYTTTKMALFAEAFFSSLGFPPLPEPFWKKSILTKQNVEMSCEPTAWDMCDGKDFRIKMCSNGTLKDFLDIHHELTHVEYFIQYHDLSFPFRAGPHPGFHEALAGTILLSVYNPTHLGHVGLAPKWKKQEVDIDINYLLRVALDKVAFLPYSYIVDLWRYKVFKGDIKANDYNKRWWELRLQYQGLAPPSQRSEEDFDPGCKFHIPGNKPYIQNFLSTILQFQFHEALCRQAGLLGPKSALHNCDISNNQKAGTILRRVMSMGATQHWRVAMNELTGTRQISSKGLVEFFKPLLAWLRKENMRNGQKIGWKNTIVI